MKIVHMITRSDIVGGAHVHVRDLALRLLAEGHEVTVLVGGQGPFTEELRRLGIPFRSLRSLVRPIQPLQDVRAVLEVLEVLRQIRPDLVATHSSKAGWLGRIAASWLGIPVIFTAHGWAFTDGVPEGARRVYMVAERVASRFASCIITVSEYDRILAIRYRVAPAQKVITIHNGIPDVQRGLWANPEVTPSRVIMVARFEPQKDHITLLRALAELRETPWTLELVGDGPLKDRIRHVVEELGLRDRVTFWGARNDVPKLLARCQLFILASRWEGLPLSILEAMRARLPVIASDVGGVGEAVEDGKTGFVVPPGDVGALRSRLALLLSRPELRVRMGEAGRRRYEANFTFDQMFERTLGVYTDILRNVGVGRRWHRSLLPTSARKTSGAHR